MFRLWRKWFRETIDLEKAKSENTSIQTGQTKSFVNSNGNRYYVSSFKREKEIPVVGKK